MAMIFGLGLIASQVFERNAASPTYRFLESIPGWPASAGTAFFLMGAVAAWSRFRSKEHHGYSALAFYGMASLTALYGALFLAGSLGRVGLLGPQSLYFTLSVVYLMHAIYSALCWIRERQVALAQTVTSRALETVVQ